MLASTFAQLRGAAVYRKVIAVLLAGCVASFVLGQAAGHSPHVSRAAVTSPAQTEAVIAGALGTSVAPPRIIVPLSSTTRAPQADHDGEHDGKDGGPHIMPPSGHHHGHHHGGQPMPPVRADSQQEV